ncbi:Sodium-transporting ATPase subunit G [Enhygromyxa salina]|uniref:Sodium-transporting ATPase subunit G n=1 Tax=Enhygromyxa salina TaxID=215803 RepID=A0A0C2DAA4_9BACT|nr:F0F1 ATP synthase subunit gamma [Enhygromyxa salina]KIG16827.1 Sodium-transporting ATPase subunit G [Enhygromyxa salina]
MTTARALGQRLGAWRSFRDIARATRTLAAVQGQRWSAHANQAALHLAWTRALVEHFGTSTPEHTARGVLVIGTDLGLCGRLNAALAAQLKASPELEGRALIAVGARLLDELRDFEPVISLPAPASLEAIEQLTSRIATALETAADHAEIQLSILLTATTTHDGHPILEIWRDAPELPGLAQARRSLAPPIVDLCAPSRAREGVAALHLRARIAHALCVAAASEAAARLFTMSRAHEASDRSIRQQELDLRKLEQEAITQDMLEVRGGSRS